LVLLGAAAIPTWTRALALLSGNSVLAATLVSSALAAGLALGLWSRQRLSLRPDTAAIVAGALGLCLPHLFRFVALNSAQPSFLYAPLRSASDAFFLAAQPAAAVGLWAAVGGLCEASRPRAASAKAPVGLLAALAPAAGTLLLLKLGPARACAAVNGLLLAYGAARRGRRWLTEAGFESKVLAAVALLGALGGWTGADPFVDAWLARLNAAYPGGRFLRVSNSLPEALGVYEFSTGLRILLRDGVADPNVGLAAWRETLLALAAHEPSKDVLLIGSRQPAAWEALSAFGSHVPSRKTIFEKRSPATKPSATNRAYWNLS
jgi:hypothetical protein